MIEKSNLIKEIVSSIPVNLYQKISKIIKRFNLTLNLILFTITRVR